jgi:putative DNA primase/helicase
MPEPHLSAFLARLEGVRQSSDGRMALCPCHEDRTPSLSVRVGDDGRILLKCFAGCPIQSIVEAAGMQMRDLFPTSEPRGAVASTYPYTDLDGVLLFEVVRKVPKGFLQRRPDGLGGWHWNLKGVSRVIYHWPEVKGNPEVCIVEGEKDVDRLWAAGVAATTCPGGAGKWTQAYTQQLIDAGVERVVVIPDSDQPGRSHAQSVAQSCVTSGLAVTVVPLSDDAKDISAWFDSGADKNDLITLIQDASPFAQDNTGDEQVGPPPSRPMAVARGLARALYTDSEGRVLLRDHRGDFYRWNGMCWREIERRDVRRAAYEWLEQATYLHKNDGEVPFDPSRRKIDDVIDALRAVLLLSSSEEVPCWTIGTAAPPANEIISMTNGLLHVPTRTLLPHTPHYFCHHALAFPFSVESKPPARWLAFLRELWADDESSIAALQEVLGYILGGDTRQQKIFLFVGPKRGGKGTIGRVLTGLLGPHNVAAPTLAGLSTNFGLQPLVGKPLGLISDARLSGRDSKVVVERLLSVSGEDCLTIDRKYKDPWTGRLPTRFVVLTNELPRLTDSSRALASRFVVFVLRNSFYGNENPGLTDELLTEAPAIFNWALEGLVRLNKRGYFVSPALGREAVQQLEDLSSPVSAFIRDTCVVEETQSVKVDALWTAWKSWCEGENRHPGTKSGLGRDLKAAVPRVKKTRPRPDDRERPYLYEGIGLLENSQENSGRSPRPLGPDEAGPGGPRSTPMYPGPEVSDDDDYYGA